MIRFDDIYFSSLEKVSHLESDNTWIAKEVRLNGQVFYYVVDIKSKTVKGGPYSRIKKGCNSVAGFNFNSCEIIYGCSVIKGDYDDVSDEFFGQLIVCKKGKYGIIDTDGKEIVPMQFDGAKDCSPDHTLAVVGSRHTFVEQKEVLYGLYDLVNKQYVITPEYEDVKCPDFPTRCFATAVMKNGRWGFKGLKGKSEMDTPFLFDDAYPFQPQGAVVLNGFAAEIFEDGHISGEWHYIDNHDDDVYIDRDPYSYMDAYEGDPSNIWNND